jgi:flagellum-specific ATP synthase
LSTQLLTEKELEIAQKTAQLLSTYERSKDLVEIGAYQSGTNPDLDKAVKLMAPLEKYLCQSMHEKVGQTEAFEKLASIIN